MSGGFLLLLCVAFLIACCIWEGFIPLVIFVTCLYHWPGPTFIVGSVVGGLVLLTAIANELGEIKKLLHKLKGD